MISVPEVSRTDWVRAEAFLSSLKRVLMFSGGFGSGKTEVAVNFALKLRRIGRQVAVADLDIVNPYFRSRLVQTELSKFGIRFLVPSGALAEADLPIIVPEVKGAIQESQGHVILDMGGDPVGARVMASLAPQVSEDAIDGMFVLNSRRPRTRELAGTLAMMKEISSACGVKLSSLVVNSHLVEETVPEVVEEGVSLAEQVAKQTGARVAFVAVARDMLDRVKVKYPVMVLDRMMLKPWEQSNWLGRFRIDN